MSKLAIITIIESCGKSRASSQAIPAPPRQAGGTGTWSETLFGSAQRRPGGREDLPGSLQSASYWGGAVVVATVAARPASQALENQREPGGALGAWLPCRKWTEGTPTPCIGGW